MLQIEKSYKDKEGQEVPFKIPRMKLQGKLMDDNETWSFLALGEVGCRQNTIVDKESGKPKIISNYSLFARFSSQPKDIESDSVILEFGEAVNREMIFLHVEKGVEFLVEKDWFENRQNGSMIPTVKLTKISPEGLKIPPKGKEDYVYTKDARINLNNALLSEKDKAFCERFRQKVNPSEWTMNFLIGTYLISEKCLTPEMDYKFQLMMKEIDPHELVGNPPKIEEKKDGNKRSKEKEMDIQL